VIGLFVLGKIMKQQRIPDKPFKTIEEQIQILRSRKLIIEDEKFAEYALFTFSYYDLINGYKECFMVDDEFRPNISIEYLYNFCRFDHRLQNIIFQYSVIVETKFKTALAYVISKNHGVFQDEYLSRNNYIRSSKNKNKVDIILSKVRETYSHNFKHLENPTKHYVDTKNHVPPWILFKNVTFNNVINLYSILNNNDKKEVCSLILDIDLPENQKLQLFKDCLTIIRQFRNKIAHKLKFISFKTKSNHLSKKVLTETSFDILFDKKVYNEAYSAIIALNIMLNKNLDLLISLNASLSSLLTQQGNKEIIQDYCNITSIPLDFDERAKNFLSDLYRH
jgi:abortive infection bacteriophage resistance protein